MAFWKLSTKQKKSAETYTFVEKDGVQLRIVEGYRWGSVCLETETDKPPVIDLDNPDGINTITIPNTEWELDYFDDGWYMNLEVDYGDISEEEFAHLEQLFDKGGIEALEEEGWNETLETEWWFFGPLEMVKES